MSDDNSTSPLAPEVSPLVEADPNSINEFIQTRVDAIFNKPPLLLNDDDLRIAVEYYRKDRQRFLTESAAKQTKATGPRRKVPTSVAEALASPQEDLL
jgi:hypothetical protein